MSYSQTLLQHPLTCCVVCSFAGWDLHTPLPSFNASKGSHYTNSEDWPTAPYHHFRDSMSSMVPSASPPLFGCPSTWICPAIKAGIVVFFFHWPTSLDKDRVSFCSSLFVNIWALAFFFRACLELWKVVPLHQVIFFDWVGVKLGSLDVIAHRMLCIYFHRPSNVTQKSYLDRSQSNQAQDKFSTLS